MPHMLMCATPPLVDPSRAIAGSLESHARLQERSLALDNAQTVRARYRKAHELQAILELDQEPEPVKAEALRELEAISQFQRQQGYRTKDAATNRSVAKAIKRLTNASPRPQTATAVHTLFAAAVRDHRFVKHFVHCDTRR